MIFQWRTGQTLLISTTDNLTVEEQGSEGWQFHRVCGSSRFLIQSCCSCFEVDRNASSAKVQIWSDSWCLLSFTYWQNRFSIPGFGWRKLYWNSRQLVDFDLRKMDSKEKVTFIINLKEDVEVWRDPQTRVSRILRISPPATLGVGSPSQGTILLLTSQQMISV